MKRYAAIAAVFISCIAYVVFAQTQPNPSQPIGAALQVSYDHTTSGMDATNVQAAISELAAAVDVINGTPTGRIGVAGGSLAASTSNRSIWQVECPSTCWVSWQATVVTSTQEFLGFRIDDPLGAPYSGTSVTVWPSDDAEPLDAEVTYGNLDNDPAGGGAVTVSPVLSFLSQSDHPEIRVDAGRALIVWTTADNLGLAFAATIRELQP